MSLSKVDLPSAIAQAKACVERVSLPLRSKTWRGQAGEFAGAGSGSSLDFHDHRTYQPGDDPRHINWQAYARTGSYTMKLYREEVRPVVDVIMDVSNSMFYEQTKAQRTVEVFLAACHSALQHGASLRIQLVSGSVSRALPVDLLSSDKWVSLIEGMERTEAVPSIQNLQLRSNAIRIFISDTLYEVEPTQLVKSLCAGHSSLIILAPFNNDEANPKWRGNCQFVDVENGHEQSHHIDNSRIHTYQQSYLRHFELWKNQSQRHHASFSRVSAALGLLDALSVEAIPNGGFQLK
ncbi:DUF58 domain-containing protein [Rubritalea sp.]|uniref:DUF58 domain-containing protein n=1 Tax=Rubritalea sp. TaxID=2109375 RepID=UPI003EF37972